MQTQAIYWSQTTTFGCLFLMLTSGRWVKMTKSWPLSKIYFFKSSGLLVYLAKLQSLSSWWRSTAKKKRKKNQQPFSGTKSRKLLQDGAKVLLYRNCYGCCSSGCLMTNSHLKNHGRDWGLFLMESIISLQPQMAFNNLWRFNFLVKKKCPSPFQTFSLGFSVNGYVK